MAKRKKKTGEGSAADSTASSSAGDGASGGKSGVAAMIVVLGLVLAAGAFVTWHRRKDPARQWARGIEQAHAQKIERRFASCLGGSDADAVRRLVRDVRQGQWGPLQACAGSRYSELIASPLDFLTDIRNPPGGAEDAQARERGRLERLRGAITAVERATGDLDRHQPIPEASRDRLATSLEDLAIELQAEHQSMEDLANVVESSASWW
jgi:hypothetical protein